VDAEQLAVVFWGGTSGLVLIPWVSLAFRVTRPRRDLDSANVRAGLSSMTSHLVACTGISFFAIFVIGAGHILGVVPLRDNRPLFGLSFIAGLLVMRFTIEVRRKRSERRRD
jgi:hypothetical protein